MTLRKVLSHADFLTVGHHDAKGRQLVEFRAREAAMAEHPVEFREGIVSLLGVVASKARLKSAAADGETRSSSRMSCNATARPLGARAAWTFAGPVGNVIHVASIG